MSTTAQDAATMLAPSGDHEATQDHGEVVGIKGGTMHGKEKWGTVRVKNGEGKARSHITLQGKWDVSPEVLFHIFTFPDNTALFRDVSCVGQRNVVTATPGLKIVEVEQHQQIKVLWMTRTFTTWLKVTEDSRDKHYMSVQFDLLKSDVLSAFSGRWELRSVLDGSGQVVGCEAELNQDVLPRGIPAVVQHVPLLGELLRGVCMRAISRVMEDLDKAIIKIKAGMAKGRTCQDVLRELCGTCEEQGHANGAVASFEVGDVSDEEEGSQAGSTPRSTQPDASGTNGAPAAGSAQPELQASQSPSQSPAGKQGGKEAASTPEPPSTASAAELLAVVTTGLSHTGLEELQPGVTDVPDATGQAPAKEK